MVEGLTGMIFETGKSCFFLRKKEVERIRSCFSVEGVCARRGFEVEKFTLLVVLAAEYRLL